MSSVIWVMLTTLGLSLAFETKELIEFAKADCKASRADCEPERVAKIVELDKL